MIEKAKEFDEKCRVFDFLTELEEELALGTVDDPMLCSYE
jgi:hypothetical protein